MSTTSVANGLKTMLPALLVFTGCGMDNANPASVPSQIDALDAIASKHSLNGDYRGALAAIDEALKIKPNDIGMVELKMRTLWNLFCEDGLPGDLLAFCDDKISQGVGPEVMYRLMKAEVYQALGTRYESDYRLVIVDQQHCLTAISELRAAIQLEPDLASVAADKDWLPMGWDEHFNGLKDFPEFQALRP